MFVFVCLFPQVHWSHQLTFNPSKQLSSQNIQNFTLSIDQMMRGAQCLLSKFELVYPNVLEWGPRCSEADGRLKQNSGEVGGGKGDRYRAPYNFRPSAALWGQPKLQRGHLQRTVGDLSGINAFGMKHRLKILCQRNFSKFVVLTNALAIYKAKLPSL